MAAIEIVLQGPGSGQRLSLTGESDGAGFALDSLRFPDGATYRLSETIDGLMEWLDNTSGNQYALKPQLSQSVSLQATWEVENTAGTFFGRPFQVAGAVETELFVLIPGPGAQGRVQLTVCGRVDLDGTSFSSEPFCHRVDIPAGGTPRLSIGLPDWGWRIPAIEIPWTFPNLPALPSRWPAMSFDVPPLNGRIGFRGLEIVHDTGAHKTRIVVRGLFLEIGSRTIEANVTLVLLDGAIVPNESSVEFLRPQVSFRFPDYYFDEDCFLLHGTGNELNQLLSFLAPELDAMRIDDNWDWTIRVRFDDLDLEEIRIDLRSTAAKTAGLPAFRIALPAGSTLHLVFRQPEAEPQRLWLGLTLAANAQLRLSLPFSWLRNTERELQPGERPAGGTEEPLEVVASVAGALTVVVARFVRGGDRFFLKKTPAPLTPLNIAQPGPSCAPTTDAVADLEAGDFRLDANGLPDLKLNGVNLNGLKLPFLRDELSAVQQWVELTDLRVEPPRFGSGPDDRFLAASIGIKVKIGGGALELSGRMQLRFFWETLAFRVNHAEGIKLKIPNPPVNQELFGLKWTFEPAPGDADFILLTDDPACQIKQVPESRLVLAFDRATREGSPIEFEVRNFLLTRSGISLDAQVTNSPAKLTAVDTEFRFTEGILQIKDNRIAAFTIGGAGALPPALVGPSVASIRMTFEQDPGDRSVRLTAAEARLQGDSLLKCESTRFQFAVTAVGLKFVEESGKYHLYFTLSGTARFVLSGGDDSSGPLGWLPAIEMQMVECPLTTDISVLARHVTFLIPLPEPVRFAFLGCFEFEVRGFGFAPMDPVFREPKPAMIVSGQVKFSSTGADAVDLRVDFHNLHIGLPAAGRIFPQIYLKGLGVKLAVGSAFELGGCVDFIDEGTDLGGGVTGEGFRGSGEMQISGLPRITAGFAFLRVRRNPQDDPVRAWFLYLEASRFSLEMPVIRVFLREIGIGFGYRMTLAMIRSVDEVEDPRELLKVLKDQAKRQGELSRFEAWRVDLEEPGEDPRWTIALRGLISQNSAASSPTDWNEEAERGLPNLFLLDVVAAVRSDLTVLMTARAWFLTNYRDFTLGRPSTLREQPLLTGFVLLSPRRKRLLANLSSNPDAEFGENSPVPEIVKLAIRGARFSATLLVEPGLVHYELGWPNQLRWEADFHVLKLQFCGGMIYRLSRTEFVIGQSFLARGSLEFCSGVNFGFVGARLSATAMVAYGARYIGVLAFEETTTESAFYGGAGIEVNVAVAVSFWIEVDLLFGTITRSFGFQFAVNFTASVEVGILLAPRLGVRGTATLGLCIMGHDLHFAIRVAFDEEAVTRAYNLTGRFLNAGLEAGDVEPIPGVPPSSRSLEAAASASARAAPQPAPLAETASSLVDAAQPPVSGLAKDYDGRTAFETPSYRVLTAHVGSSVYLLLVPGGEVLDSGRLGTNLNRERGFLPVPPRPTTTVTRDFSLSWVPSGVTVSKANSAGAFTDPYTQDWKADWDSTIDFNKLDREAPYVPGSHPQGASVEVLLREWLSLAYAFRKEGGTGPKIENWSEIFPAGDPDIPFVEEDVVVDQRVHDPAEDSFEAAVRGAVDQFTASPYFKRSDSEYDVTLREAFDHQTSLYAQDGVAPPPPADPTTTPEHLKAQQVFQTRAVVVRTLVSEFQGFVERVRAGGDPGSFGVNDSLACRLGLVFRCELTSATPEALADSLNAATISQRIDPTTDGLDATPQPVRVFNPPDRSFRNLPPEFNSLVHYEHEGTVAIDWSLEWPNRPRTAAASARLGSGGSVAEVRIEPGSRGYDADLPPHVSIDPPGAAAVAERAGIIGGALSAAAVRVTLAGDGYDPNSPPAVTIAPPPGTGGVQATAHIDPARIDPAEGTISSDAVVLDNAGSGYDPRRPPAVTIELPAGRVAAAVRLNLTRINALTGELAADAVEITAAGSGYTAAPRVTVEAPGRRSEFDPMHHLDHYVVRRRWLDGSTGEREFRVEPADVLHRDRNNRLKRLKPRFQFVDHFEDEPAETLAALPPEGRRYAYTITPIDLTGVASLRPKTIVVRRRPSTPPPPITESEFTVDYRISQTAMPAPPNALPKLCPIERFTFTWTPPVDPTVGPRVAVAAIRLVFRRDEVLAIGQYAQDSDVGGPRSRGLATSNARPLRTDRLFEFALSGDLTISELTNEAESQRRFFVELPRREKEGAPSRLPDLDEPYTAATRDWQPRAWRVFVQTKSAGGVYSALTPVTIRMRFKTSTDPLSPAAVAPEERRPGALEWLPEPMRMDLLPPRDLSGQAGFAQVPTPSTLPITERGWVPGRFRLHPSRRRCLRIEWNQAGTPGAPVVPRPVSVPREYHAGYELYEFDVDSQSPETIDQFNPTAPPRPFSGWAAEAGVRRVQRFEMLPADLLLTSPADTADTQIWEAWYPSAMTRLDQPRPRRSESVFSPWYSWRESVLEWPDVLQRCLDPESAENPAKRYVLREKEPFHPALQQIVEALVDKLDPDGSRGVVAVFGAVPAMPPTLPELVRTTSPDVDPYGWGLLQRLGLAASFTLRDGFGEPLPVGDATVAGTPLHHLLELLKEPGAPWVSLRQHLFAEVLYQPARAVRLARDETRRTGELIAPGELLAVLQLSLRPVAREVLSYARYEVPLDPSVDRCEARIEPAAGTTATVVIKGVDAEASHDVTDAGLKIAIELPPRSRLVILARHVKQQQMPRITLTNIFTANNTPLPDVPLTGVKFEVTDADTRYFTFDPDDVFASFAVSDKRWTDLRRLFEAMNPRVLRPDQLTLVLPETAAEPGANTPVSGGELLGWLERFFDHGGNWLEYAQGGPWVATAYPRSRGVTAIAPHETTGLLEYCHPVEDLYAHTWRYYMRPSGRYDALWMSLAQSHPLFRDANGNVDYTTIAASRSHLESFQAPPPGGLDLTIPRIRPLAAPGILFSGRLDAPPSDDGSVLLSPPGKTWQVVLARHVEQMQVEKNRTLARRLAFRQLSVALFRQFQYEDLIGETMHWYRTPDFPPQGPILSTGDSATVTIGGRTRPLTLPTNDLSGLIAALLAEGIVVQRWDRTTSATALIIRHVAQDLEIHREVNGGGQQDWSSFVDQLPAFDEFASVELPTQGPILGTGEQLFLIVSPNATPRPEVQLTPNNLDLDALTVQLVQHVEGLEIHRAISRLPAVSRLVLHSPVKGVQLEVRSTGGTRQLVSSRRPHPRWTTQPAQLPGPFAAVARRNPLGEYQVEDVDELRQLDLPPRLGRFGQGAVVYQWQGLPFYYRRVLLAVAQSTDVVSEITVASQRDFEYVSPLPRALMDGLRRGAERYRRIRVRLENLWNCLPLESRDRWPLEAPQSLSPEEPQPYSAAIDPGVMYQFVVSRPGGVTQILSQIFYSGSQAARFDVRNFPCEVDGRQPSTTIIKRLPWGEDPTRPYEEYLETQLIPGSTEVVLRAISSRHLFDHTKFTDAATGTARLATPADPEVFPRSAALVLTGRLTETQIDDLARLLGGPRDIAFRTQSERFLQRVREFHSVTGAGDVPDIREEVSVGIDQLAELADRPDLVEVDWTARRVTWISSSPTDAFTAEQLRILDTDPTRMAWKQSAACGATIAALLTATPETEIVLLFTAGEPTPTIGSGHPLENRLEVRTIPGEVVWQPGTMSNAERTALSDLADPGSGFGPTFRAAMERLLEIGDRVIVRAAIQEPDARPRPTYRDFAAASLGDRAGFQRGMLSFAGIMLRHEAEQIQAARVTDNGGAPLVDVDAAVIRQLHNDSLRAGFAGGVLRIQAIRGSAEFKQTDIEPFLPV